MSECKGCGEDGKCTHVCKTCCYCRAPLGHTWRKEIQETMRMLEDDGPVIAYSVPDSALDMPWRRDWAPTEAGKPVAWTDTYVYICTDSDLGSYCEYALRNPPEIPAHEPRIKVAEPFALPDGSGRVFDPEEW